MINPHLMEVAIKHPDILPEVMAGQKQLANAVVRAGVAALGIYGAYRSGDALLNADVASAIQNEGAALVTQVAGNLITRKEAE